MVGSTTYLSRGGLPRSADARRTGPIRRRREGVAQTALDSKSGDSEEARASVSGRRRRRDGRTDASRGDCAGALNPHSNAGTPVASLVLPRRQRVAALVDRGHVERKLDTAVSVGCRRRRVRGLRRSPDLSRNAGGPREVVRSTTQGGCARTVRCVAAVCVCVWAAT